MQPIPHFHAGQRWSQVQATDLNRMVDVYNSMAVVSADGIVQVQQTSSGLAIGLSLDALLSRIPTAPEKSWYSITTNSGSGAYVCRLQVWDSSGHDLDDSGSGHPDYAVTGHDVLERDWAVAGAIVEGWWVRAADADRLVLDVAGSGTHGTPASLLPADPSAESEAAETDTWDRDNPAGGKDGVDVKLQTRTAYVVDGDGGDEILYAYYRLFTFDSAGKLVTISAETRYAVDTPDVCVDLVTDAEYKTALAFGGII